MPVTNANAPGNNAPTFGKGGGVHWDREINNRCGTERSLPTGNRGGMEVLYLAGGPQRGDKQGRLWLVRRTFQSGHLART